MTRQRLCIILGSGLVAVGCLLVAASYVEQPDRIKSTPNRFYSKAEAKQYQQDAQLLQSVVFATMGRAMSGQIGQEETEIKLTPEEAAAKDRVIEAEEVQAAAHLNQHRLSRAFSWLGVAALAVGVGLLMTVSRARRARPAVRADIGAD